MGVGALWRVFAVGLSISLAACQTTTPPRTEIPATLRQPCTRPDGVEQVRTVGDLAAFSIRQDGALKVCEAKRAGAISILDAINATPKHGFWPWFEGVMDGE